MEIRDMYVTRSEKIDHPLYNSVKDTKEKSGLGATACATSFGD